MSIDWRSLSLSSKFSIRQQALLVAVCVFVDTGRTVWQYFIQLGFAVYEDDHCICIQLTAYITYIVCLKTIRQPKTSLCK